MSELGIITILLQIAFCVHAVRHGKEWYWLLFIILIPLLGCAVYFLTQVLPEIVQNRKLKQTGTALINTLDPQREVRRLEDELEAADTIDNRLALADACLQAGQIERAIELYERSLTGIHQDDTGIMTQLARATFMHQEYTRTKDLLEKVFRLQDTSKSYDAQLLYAQTLEALSLTEQAVQAYEDLRESYPGEEARVRYGLLLQKIGSHEQAQTLFKETMTRIKRAPRFYLKKEKQWIEIASENLK